MKKKVLSILLTITLIILCIMIYKYFRLRNTAHETLKSHGVSYPIIRDMYEKAGIKPDFIYNVKIK